MKHVTQTPCSRSRHARWLWLLILAAGASSGCPEREQGVSEAEDRWNVLLITLDTTRRERLGCYGCPRATSPNLDALAAEGYRFDNAIAQAAVTPVSHASILTGLNPPGHGARVLYAERGYRVSDSVPTMATLLAERGWHTAAYLSSFTVAELFGLDRGFAVYDSGCRDTRADQIRSDSHGVFGWDMTVNQRRSDATTDQAIAWLEQKANRPFAMWVHYWDPHDTTELPPPEYLARFRPTGPTKEDRLSATYDAELAFVDANLGRLLEFLRTSGLYDRTLIVVVADHGEGLVSGLAHHGWWRHRLLYQEQIRVPLIVRVPGSPEGGVIGATVRTIDILPTVLDYLGVTGTGEFDGASLRGLIAGRSEAPRLAYADALNGYDLTAGMVRVRPHDRILHSVSDQDWKLIYRPDQPAGSELYDLRQDPHELNNLYAPSHPQVERLLAELRRVSGFVDDARLFGGGSGQADVIKRLGSLGYAGVSETGTNGPPP
ncbi:MAG: sulfatase-like hydrolase/transferase [bacterium]|nr:sulfatase-like hydrolase/transferase [bacterium]